MLISCFESYLEAKTQALSNYEGGKRHPGLKGKEYRVYRRHGEYQLWSGYSYNDFPKDKQYLFCQRI